MAGIYIHVPFCKTRCIYCDFFTGTDKSLKSQYVSAACSEIEMRKDYLKGDILKTIYFGGGTPSQLNKEDFELIFTAIYHNFEVVADAEITLEANPDDLDQTYLNMLRTLPFNRISIGIQSFDDKELQFLKRRHSAQRAIEVVAMAQDTGFDNISIDLMYGLPNQTMEIWTANFDTALSLNIQHISAYHLIYEQDTHLYKLWERGKVTPVDEDISVDMFSLMINRLRDAGFEHYEISNFAKNGLYSKHNSSYWLGDKYLGIGGSAHSFDGQNRAWNIASLAGYINAIKDGTPSIEIEHLDADTRYNDFILTGMRTMWGVDMVELKNQFGSERCDYCLKNVDKYIKDGFATSENDKLILTPKGIFISDGIMSDLMFVS